jgi:putative flippase GtrA
VSVADVLRRRLSTTWRLLLKEVSAFGAVGAVALVLDLSLFQLLYAHVGFGAVTAKLVSTLASMTVAYAGHRYWSFSHRSRTSVRREYLLFVLINAVTLMLGLGIVAFVRYALGQDGALVLQVANVGSTAIGTLIRYVSYRQWVFPAPQQPAAAEFKPQDPVADVSAGADGFPGRSTADGPVGARPSPPVPRAAPGRPTSGG